MSKSNNDRLMSLDTFRGIAMFMVLIEYSHLNYIVYAVFSEKPFFSNLALQLHHHKWNGMYFWDIGQPYFMFIIGVAMAYSMSKRCAREATWGQTFKHILYRCFILFMLGIILQINIRGILTFELWNILSTLAFSILLSFLIIKFRNATQLIISFSLLIIYEMSFRLILLDGFDQPYVRGHNLGSYVDLMLMGKMHPDGWITISAISATAHVIWGVLTGKMLMRSIPDARKLKLMVVTGIAGLAVGYGMDWTGLSPINKHLSTSSFVIASGGWCFITLAFLYWLIDMAGYRRWTIIFTVVGMNPIFIYVVASTIGRKWLNGFIAIFTEGFLGGFVNSTGIINGITSLLAICFEWYLCYWLYKKRIFIKI